MTAFICSKYRDITRRTDSGSSRSPSAVEETTSEKSTVTVFLTSRAGTTGSRAVPQPGQNRASSGLSLPHALHTRMTRVYGVRWKKCRRSPVLCSTESRRGEPHVRDPSSGNRKAAAGGLPPRVAERAARPGGRAPSVREAGRLQEHG